MSGGSSQPWNDTEPATWVLRNSQPRIEGGSQVSLGPNKILDPESTDLVEYGLFARLVPQNRSAREAFQNLAENPAASYEYHRQFMRTGSGEINKDTSERSDCFIFSLGLLPEFPRLGWRIGRGRTRPKNYGVDILIPDGDEVAGIHARFCWLKGTGGFFIVADNSSLPHVTLNGEQLQHTQRLIPFRNTISFGECYYTVRFETRSPEQEEQFQMELSLFYSRVLEDSIPFVLPTPSENETRIGNWIVGKPIASGAFGQVSVVTHAQTGVHAAMKELWETPRNVVNVKREVAMARRLKNWNNKRLGTPFEITHKPIYDKTEMARIAALLDETWRPSGNDTINYYTLYSPLSTGNFYALIKSKASLEVRTRLFTQVMEGLAFLHENGVVHRDIKPANLTVKSYDPPDAQIIDFGCATFETNILYDRPGTISYLAPEQTEGKYHNKSVDYWSMALVGVELLGFERPQVRTSPDTYLNIHRWLSGQLHQAMALCCKCMLQMKPEDRMSATKAIEGCLSSSRYLLEDDRKRSLHPTDNRVKKKTSYHE